MDRLALHANALLHQMPRQFETVDEPDLRPIGSSCLRWRAPGEAARVMITPYTPAEVQVHELGKIMDVEVGHALEDAGGVLGSTERMLPVFRELDQ